MDIDTRCLAISFVDTLFLRANNETRIRGKMSVTVLAQSYGHFCANM